LLNRIGYVFEPLFCAVKLPAQQGQRGIFTLLQGHQHLGNPLNLVFLQNIVHSILDDNSLNPIFLDGLFLSAATLSLVRQALVVVVAFACLADSALANHIATTFCAMNFCGE